MQAEALSALLCRLYDPACPAAQKHHAEQQLNAFSNSLDGLEWALICVQSPNADPQQQFFAASVLEGAVARRWSQLPPTTQATLQNCLWMHVIHSSNYALPHFVTSKLRAALAQLACIKWQLQFWEELQACLNSPATAEAGVRLIGATLEQLHSMALGTTSALCGKVLSSDLPTMQSHRQEAHIMSYQMLCPFLERLIATNHSNNNNLAATLAAVPPGLLTATLDALRVAISTSNVEIFSTCSTSGPGTELATQVVTLLLPFLSLAAMADSPASSLSSSLPNSNQLVILAMACLEDLINRPHQPLLKQKIVAHVLPTVSALCRSWRGAITSTTTTTATTATASSSLDMTLDIDLLGIFTRLLTQTLQQSFTFAPSNPEIAAKVQEVLQEITNLAAAKSPPRRSAVNLHLIIVLAAAEAWHAVLTYMEDLEASNWNEDQDYFGGGNTQSDANAMTSGNDNDNESASEKQLLSFYKQGILHFSRLLLSIFFTGDSQQYQQHQVQQQPLNLPSSPPFLLQNLDTSTGSRAVVEDWVAAVGENNEDFQTDTTAENEAGNDEDEEEEEESVNTAKSDSFITSEAHVFAQQVEFFIAHATSSYNKELVPILFSLLAPAITASTQARQQQQEQQHPGNQAAVYLCNFRAEFALKLIARCAPHLPTNALLTSGAGGSVLEEEEGGLSLSGGHVLQLILALLQFGDEQLKLVHIEAQQAQHAQQQQQQQMALDTIIAIYRTLSPLMTTWLPQIMLTRASTDFDDQMLVSQLFRAVIDFIAAGIESSVFLSRIHLAQNTTNFSVAAKRLALAASQTLLSITSIALSSGMKPPTALLQTITSMPAVSSLSTAVASSVQPTGYGQQSESSMLPRSALRSLVVSSSDLALRSWGSVLQTSTTTSVERNERKAAFAAVTGPLLQVLQSATTQVQSAPASFAAAPQVSLAASLARDVVESYVGSSKVVRGAVFEVFAQPMLMSAVTVLKYQLEGVQISNNPSKGTKNKLGTTFLNFISSCLRAFPAELGTSNIGELLSALVAAFSTTPTTMNTTLVEATLDADIVLLSIITSALSQGGSKHATLVLPAMNFGLQVWDKAAVCGATHIKSQVLASLLGIMAQHWRTLGGGGGSAGGGNVINATAAGVESEVEPPDAVVTTTLTHVSSFLSDAASTRAIPSASDINLVLETLIDIQSRSKIFWKPFFSGWKDATMESILSMLLTRMYTGAQENLIGTLYQLAAANWSHFLLSFLPAFAEKGLAGLGARGAELAAGLGTADMEVWEFEKGVLAFVNDAIYWEKRCLFFLFGVSISMQPSMEHFSELRQLLHTGHYENDARQPVNARSTRARPAQQPDSLIFSAQQHAATRAPLARSGVAASTRSRRPPPAPTAHPPFVGQGSVRIPASRPAATRNDVDLYLAQLNHQQQPQQHHSTRQASFAAAAAAAAAAQQPAPEQHRRAKRGKPMARRSLQALFDLAAEDSSTWQTSASTAGDTEDDGDTGIFTCATSGESSKQPTGNNPSSIVPGLTDALLAAAAAAAAGMPGPSTPANCDSGLLGEAVVGAGAGTPAIRPESPADAAATAVNGVVGGKNIQDNLSSIVPLRHLLMSDRGRTLTAVEAKAIIFRVAKDLAALHSANAVHRRVSIESISLTTCLADGSNNSRNNNNRTRDGASPSMNNSNTTEIAVAILPAGRSAAVLGSNRCYWALKDPAFDAHHAPPEVACCPVDRPVAFTPAGDMWGLGVVLFSLLSAGRVPFTAPSCLCGGGENKGEDRVVDTLTSTVDALQRHLYSHLHCQIDVINQLSAAQAAGAIGSNEEDALEMAAIGFDSQAQKLLLGLLHADPAQRLSAVDVLNHPWVAEAIPFVPKMPASSLPFAKSSGPNSAAGGGAGGIGNGTARESTPPMSDVLRRTEQLGFSPQSTNTLPAPAAAAECPYPIIGHVAQPLEVIVGGRKITISALHAVYDVPGYGAMMSATPLAVADPAEVSAAAAAAAANGHLPVAEGAGHAPLLNQFLNLGNCS